MIAYPSYQVRYTVGKIEKFDFPKLRDLFVSFWDF